MTESAARRRSANVPGGRPGKHEVTTSTEEEAIIVLAASKQGPRGVTPARFLRESALAVAQGNGLGGAVTTATQRRDRMAELFALRHELATVAVEVKRVGVNLNQLARKANAGDGAFPVTEVREHLLEERQFLQKLRGIADGIDARIDELRAEGVDV